MRHGLGGRNPPFSSGGRCCTQNLERQLTYDIAVLDEYAPRHGRLDAQMDLFEPEQAAELAGKVWLDESFWTVIYELAAGAAATRRWIPGRL